MIRISEKYTVGGFDGCYTLLSYTLIGNKVDCVLEKDNQRICVKRQLSEFKQCSTIGNEYETINVS